MISGSRAMGDDAMSMTATATGLLLPGAESADRETPPVPGSATPAIEVPKARGSPAVLSTPVGEAPSTSKPRPMPVSLSVSVAGSVL